MEINRESLHKILDRYLKDQCTEAERLQVDYWYSLIDNEKELSDSDYDTLEKTIWNKVDQERKASVFQSKKTQLSYKTIFTWIASSAAACLIAIFIYSPFLKQEPTLPVLPYTACHSDSLETPVMVKSLNTPLEVILPDQSKILLDPNTTIYYSKDFVHSRNVYLKGTAYFNVIPDKAHPFYVFAGKVLTKVVGTSFTINSDENAFEVLVHTGKVEVSKYNINADKKLELVEEKNLMQLTKNQKVSLKAETGTFVLDIRDTPINPVPNQSFQSIDDQFFLFESSHLVDVIKLLESTYNITVTVKNQKLLGCPITADLRKETLTNKLDIICAALNASYIRSGSEIQLLNGQCN